MTDSTTVTFRLPQDEAQLIECASEKMGVTKSEFIRGAAFNLALQGMQITIKEFMEHRIGKYTVVDHPQDTQDGVWEAL